MNRMKLHQRIAKKIRLSPYNDAPNTSSTTKFRDLLLLLLGYLDEDGSTAIYGCLKGLTCWLNHCI